MLESLIEIEGQRTISRINENMVDRTDVSNDIKFIRDTTWTKDDLLEKHREYFRGIAKGSPIGFFIIDDSVLEKAGKPKKMQGLGWHYSHSKGRVIYGHCIVSCQYRVGSVSFPYDFEFYRSEKNARKEKVKFKTKIDIARKFIEDFKPFSDEKIYVLMDSWYPSQEIIRTVKSRGFDVIGGLKGNRVFKLQEQGPKHTLSVYAQNLRNASFEEVKLGDAAFLVKRVECWLPKIGKVVILISKRKRDRSKCFILSTDTALSNEEILRYYSYRWDIETGYLYCKDRLGLGHYQMRNMKAIEKFCALVISAFCYLEALRVLSKRASIGQSRWYFKIARKRQFVDRVANLVKRGVSMQKIYKELKLVA
jgi:SRSO17 transposase